MINDKKAMGKDMDQQGARTRDKNKGQEQGCQNRGQ